MSHYIGETAAAVVSTEPVGCFAPLAYVAQVFFVVFALPTLTPATFHPPRHLSTSAQTPSELDHESNP